MPTLIETFIDYEPDLLEMIAEGWGIDQDLDAGKNLARQVSERLQDEPLIDEILQALPRPAYSALQRLVRSRGRLPVGQFEREFGSLREMGAARRAKIRPDRNPASVSEGLYYKGLVARAFLREGGEPQDCYYLPEEFQRYLEREIGRLEISSMPALPTYAPAVKQTPDDAILEHACTLLAALRSGIPPEQVAFENPTIPAPFLSGLLSEAGLLGKDGQPEPEQIGAFLEAPRAASFATLVRAWQSSANIDELDWLSGVEVEGKVETRSASYARLGKILAMLKPLSTEHWLDIDEFTAWIKTCQPDFLRSGGEYDSWIVRDRSTSQYLKGYEHWDQVEGALLRARAARPVFLDGFG